MRAVLACAVISLTACEWIGPQIDKNPLLLPQSKRTVETVPLAQSAHFDATNQMSEPEVYKAHGGRIGKAPTPAAPSTEGDFTLNFDEADLGEVAKVILGESLKKNYVISPKVAGKVTLRTVTPLAEKELLPTLEMVLRMNGAILVADKGGYRIEPDSEAARRGALARVGYRLQVVPLKYVSAQDMQTVLQPILPANAILKTDTARNLLFLAGSGEDLERVIEIVQVFDVNFLQGMSFGLYPLKNVAVHTIFSEMQAMFGEGAGGPLAGTIRLLPIERLNAVMAITAQPIYLEELRTWVERLDRSNSAGGGNMHVYRVQHVDAVQLAITLSQVLGTGGGGGFGMGLAPGLRSTTMTGGSSGGFGGGAGSGGMGGNSTSGSGTTASSSSNSPAGKGPMGGNPGTGIGSIGSGGRGGEGGLATGGMGSGGFGAMGGYNASAGGMGTNSSGGGMGGGTGENAVRVTPDVSNNALVIVAPPFEYQAIEKLLRELDVMPLQVLIDAMIVEVTLSDELEYGLKWYFEHGGSQWGANITKDIALNASGFGYALLASDLKVAFNALASKNKIRVLSTPSLMVLNNQQASIKVGTQVPIRTSEATNTSSLTTLTGGTPSAFVTSQIQMRDTGVQLTIRPRVNKGGLVTLDVQQSVDEISNENKGSNIDSPAILQRQINSSVAVKDNDTIVLGGLIKDTGSSGVGGIPILSSLPWIGPLFGTTLRKANRTELVVLITPHVVDGRDKLLSVTDEYKSRLKVLQLQSE